MNTHRTSHRASAVAFAAIAASLAALPDASAQFQAPTDVKTRIPNVLLLLDSSISMSWALDGGAASCKDELNPRKARYTILGEALTGTVDDLDCWSNGQDPMSFGRYYVPLMSNSQRHQPGGQNCVPAMNYDDDILASLESYPMGWPYMDNKYDAGAVAFCGGKNPSETQKCFNYWNYKFRSKCYKSTIGWNQNLDGLLDTYAQKIRFGLMSFDGLSLPGYDGDPYLWKTGPFGSWNFWHEDMGWGWKWAQHDPSLTCRNGTSGEQCVYSFYWDWLYLWFYYPSTWVLPLDWHTNEWSYWHGDANNATSTWLTGTRSVGHFLDTATIGGGGLKLRDADIGARNSRAFPAMGRLIGFGTPDATAAETVDHNEMVQDAILGLSTNLQYTTPIAALMRDAYEFIHNDTTTQSVVFPHDEDDPPKLALASPKNDPYFSATNRCRETIVMLVSDGEPTADLTDRAGFWANKLAVDDDVTTIVVGIGLEKATWRSGSTLTTTYCSDLKSTDYSTAATSNVMCTRDSTGWKFADNGAYTTGVTDADKSALRACCNLLETAYLGDPTNKFGRIPYFPNDQAQLKQTMDGLLKSIAGATVSRTVPVFANITSSFNPGNATAAYYELRSAMLPSAKPTSGTLERIRYTCNASSEPVRQSVSETLGDQFHKNLDFTTGTRQRKIFTAVPVKQSGKFSAKATIRPSSVVYDELTGISTIAGDFRRLDGTSPDLNPLDGYAGDVAETPDTLATKISSLTTTGSLKAEELLNITSVDIASCSSQLGTTSTSECAKRVLQWYTGSPTTYTLPGGSQSASRDPSVCGGYDKCGQLGAIYRSNPLIVPPPEPNAAEQSFSNNRVSGAASFYQQYKTRPTMLFAQSIDGMLHAFVMSSNASGSDPFATGIGSSIGTGTIPLVDKLENNELWSFIPPAILPQIWPNFKAEARLLDGPIAVANVVFDRTDVETQQGLAGDSGFRTVLVASSGYGESGFYYALDVTNPLSPRFLWQLLNHQAGGVLFGKVLPGAAVTTLKIRDPQTNTIKQVGVALLPGGRDPGTPTKIKTQRSIFSSARSPIFSWGGPAGSYRPRTKIRDWGTATPTRSLTVVELETGRIIARLSGAWADNPGEVGKTCSGNSAGASASDCGLATTTLVNPTRVSFDSPITGTPVAFPSGTGQVATRAYVGDADGTLWRIDFSDPDPLDWTAEIAFDAYNHTSTPNNTLKNAYRVNGTGAGTPLNASYTEDDGALLGQPVEQAPTVSVDTNNTPVVTFSTGDQDSFNAISTGMVNVLATFVDVPNDAGTAFSPTVDATRGLGMAFLDGGRVTGPLTLFDGKLFFSYFAPGAVSTCSSGNGGYCGVDYLAGTNGLPKAVMNLNNIAGMEVCTQFLNGEVVFGIAVNAVPSCVQTEDNFNDQFLAGQYNSYSGSKGLTYQLVMQTSQGGATEDGSQVNTTRMDLAPPRSKTRLQSWVSVMQ